MRIELTQEMTVLYAVNYSREQVIDLLRTLGPSCPESLDELSDAELGTALAASVNDYGDNTPERDTLRDAVVNDAGDWVDTTNLGDWKFAGLVNARSDAGE